MSRPPIASFDGLSVVPEEQAAFIRARVAGFASSFAVREFTLEHLLCEAYFQGVTDTVGHFVRAGVEFPDPEIPADA